MKYLGIDFGTKYVGLAMSDEGGQMAFPYQVIPNNKEVGEVIKGFIKAEGIQEIVMGHSINQAGIENKAAEAAKKFWEYIDIDLPIHWQDERFSSLEASRHLFDNRPIANPRRKEHSTKRDDDSAAAIILQRFLDKEK